MTQYTRGANPYGQSYAAQGAVFKAGLQAGFSGNVSAYVKAGAVQKFFAPIGEPHCIANAQGGLKDGGTVNVAGWINEIFNWALKYNIRSYPGQPVNDKIIPIASAPLSNGVYQVQTGVGPQQLTRVISGTRTLAQ